MQVKISQKERAKAWSRWFNVNICRRRRRKRGRSSGEKGGEDKQQAVKLLSFCFFFLCQRAESLQQKEQMMGQSQEKSEFEDHFFTQINLKCILPFHSDHKFRHTITSHRFFRIRLFLPPTPATEQTLGDSRVLYFSEGSCHLLSMLGIQVPYGYFPNPPHP